MSRHLALHALVATAVTGCAPHYVYEPRNPTAWLDGYPASTTAVPPEAPQGSVEVASFGVVELTAGDGPVEALHARLAVTNDGDATPWSLATQEQVIDLPGYGQRRPMYVNTDAPTGSTIQIAQRQRRVIDCYYALPRGIHDLSQLAGFQLLWKVTTPAREVASRTPFERFERADPEPSPEVMFYAGWGPHWWYDPFWIRPRFGYYGPVVILRPGRVVISRPPRWHHHRPGHRG